MAERVGTPILQAAVAEGAHDQHMVLNMGPQHPSMHGVLRLVVEIDGEIVVRLYPEIGYLHTGIEKTCGPSSINKSSRSPTASTT